MSRERNMIGFEYGAPVGFNNFPAAFVIETDAASARSGTRFCRYTAASGTTFAQVASGGVLAVSGGVSIKRALLRLAVRIETYPAAAAHLFGFNESGSGEQALSAFVSPTGQLGGTMTFGGAPSWASGVSLALGVWNLLTLDVAIDAANVATVTITGPGGSLVVSAAFSATIPLLRLGGPDTSALICSFDDLYYEAAQNGDGISALVLPDSTRIFPVPITGQGSLADFTGAAANCAEAPLSLSPDLYQAGVAGDSTTFDHAGAISGDLLIGPDIEGLKAYAAAVQDPAIGTTTSSVEILINGAVVATYTNLLVATAGDYKSMVGFDWAPYTQAEFSALEYGITYASGAAGCRLGAMFLEVLSEGAPAPDRTQIRGETQIKSRTISADRIILGALTNAEIAAAAGIALSKLAALVIRADGAQAFSGDQSMGGHTLADLADPVASQDAATKIWALALAASILPASPAKGDIIAYDGSAWVRKAVGSNGEALTADSTKSDGLDWVTPSGGGGGGGGLVPLEERVASSSASLDFTTRNVTGQSGASFQSDYDEYIIQLINLVPSVVATTRLNARMSSNGGSSWISTGSYYDSIHYSNTAGTAGVEGEQAVTAWILHPAYVNASSGQTLNGYFRVTNPLSTAAQKVIDGTSNCIHTVDGLPYRGSVTGWLTSLAAMNAIQFFFDAGLVLTGTARLLGIPK